MTIRSLRPYYIRPSAYNQTLRRPSFNETKYQSTYLSTFPVLGYFYFSSFYKTYLVNVLIQALIMPV